MRWWALAMIFGAVAAFAVSDDDGARFLAAKNDWEKQFQKLCTECQMDMDGARFRSWFSKFLEICRNPVGGLTLTILEVKEEAGVLLTYQPWCEAATKIASENLEQDMLAYTELLAPDVIFSHVHHFASLATFLPKPESFDQYPRPYVWMVQQLACTTFEEKSDRLRCMDSWYANVFAWAKKTGNTVTPEEIEILGQYFVFMDTKGLKPSVERQDFNDWLAERN